MGSPIEERILDILRAYLGPILAKSVLSLSGSWAGVDTNRLRAGDDRKLINELRKGLRVYVSDASDEDECIARLSELFAGWELTGATAAGPTAITIENEADIVTARGRGSSICSQLGFPKVVQVKVATVISELARNIVQYGVRGEITITPIENGIEVVARDQGPGIANLDAVLSGEYSSSTGMGKGLIGTKRIMDEFEVQTHPGAGTEIRVRKFL